MSLDVGCVCVRARVRVCVCVYRCMTHDMGIMPWLILLRVTQYKSKEHVAYVRKRTKNFVFADPTQFWIHGQWWSIRITHLLHCLQCIDRGGLYKSHFLQNLACSV